MKKIVALFSIALVLANSCGGNPERDWHTQVQEAAAILTVAMEFRMEATPDAMNTYDDAMQEFERRTDGYSEEQMQELEYLVCAYIDANLYFHQDTERAYARCLETGSQFEFTLSDTVRAIIIQMEKYPLYHQKFIIGFGDALEVVGALEGQTIEALDAESALEETRSYSSHCRDIMFTIFEEVFGHSYEDVLSPLPHHN